MRIDIHTHHLCHETPIRQVLAVNAPLLGTDWHSSPFNNEKALISLGIHPWSASLWNLDSISGLKKDLLNSRVKLIGEVGLDKACEVPLETQKGVLSAQLKIAEHAGKPVILHVVRAMAEILEFKKKHPGIPAWIIHGFRGGKHEAEQYINKGFYLSFGAKFNPAGLIACPLDKLFLETDESEEGIGAVYDRVANALGCKPEDLEEQIERNFNSVFKKE